MDPKVQIKAKEIIKKETGMPIGVYLNNHLTAIAENGTIPGQSPFERRIEKIRDVDEFKNIGTGVCIAINGLGNIFTECIDVAKSDHANRDPMLAQLYALAVQGRNDVVSWIDSVNNMTDAYTRRVKDERDKD